MTSTPPNGPTIAETSDAATDSDEGRPLPFILRVAAEWIDIDDDSRLYEAVFFKQRMKLTGNVHATSAGEDVCFNDLG